MGYTDVFGGNLIFPSRVSYLELTTAIDVTLQWPTEQQITGGDVVADVMDVNTTAPALNIDMPDARNTSLGNKATFNNVGGNTFTVRDVTGGTIQDVQPGEQWVVILTDNSTDMGLWTTFLLGGNAATPASASVLAGDGLEADGSQLNQIIDSDVEAATPFTVVSGDRAKCLIYIAGAGTCNLPSAGAVDIGNNWFFMLRNSGSGTLNIVPPAGDIDGASSLNLDPNGSTFIFTDGVDWFTIGLTVASTIAFDFVSLAVPGSGDFVLSGANLDRISYRFTGALTGNRRIVVPNTTQQYWADNQTSGAFTLEVSTAAGAGITIPQGQSVIVYCDATDVINATSSTSVAFPITIGQGGTSATTASGARANLNAAFDGILIETQADSGLAGGSDLTANVVLLLDVDNLIVETTIDTAADFLAVFDADAGAMRKFLIEDVVPSPDSLIDSGGNVRAFAATGSNLQLRSDGNSDAVPRRLQFTHQDETVVGFIGWNSFSEEMFIQNNINNADGTIEISTTHASAEILIGDRLRILSTLQVRGSANNNAAINFTTTAFVNRARIGYTADDALRFEGLPQEDVIFEGEESGTATVSMLEMNPDTGCHLFFDVDGEIARSASLANGGFEVNNTLTGGGFERVLTESDIETGSFTGTLTGFTVNPTGTVQWIRFTADNGDDMVMLSIGASITGTSNATTFAMTGVPAALRPTTAVNGVTFCRNNSAFVNTLTKLEPSGQIDFYFPTGGNASSYSFTTWTASGVKGLEEGWTFAYRLN
jgi:hypothetical protein